MDVARSQVVGEQTVRYTNAEEVPLRDLYLRLFPNTPGYGGEMKVSSIRLNGEPASPEVRLNGSALRLLLNPPLASMETVTLSLAFTATVPLTDEIDYAQFSYVRGVMALLRGLSPDPCLRRRGLECGGRAERMAMPSTPTLPSIRWR